MPRYFKMIKIQYLTAALVSLFLLTPLSCSSQDVTNATTETKQIEQLSNPTVEKEVVDKFINLRYIGNNSKVGSSPAVNHIGLLDTSTNNFQGFNADIKPTSLASTAKVIVALVVLEDIQNGKYTLNSSVIMPDWARAFNGYVGSNVKENVLGMLSDSDNNSTNALIVKAGGFVTLNSKLKKYGLEDSAIRCMLSPKTVSSKSCIGTNQSTMRDLVYAMNEIRIRDNSTSRFMIDALKKAKNSFNHTNRLFNKYGMNSNTLADVGVIATDINGIHKEYVYAVNTDFKGTKDNGNNYATVGPKKPTKLLTDKKDPVSKAIQWIVNDLEKGFKVKEGVD
jgi:D-alanyl-D-alanine carboxypeptidase